MRWNDVTAFVGYLLPIGAIVECVICLCLKQSLAKYNCIYCVRIYKYPSHCFQAFCKYTIGVELLGHMIIWCLVFWRPVKLSIVAVLFYMPTRSVTICPRPCQYFLFSLKTKFYGQEESTKMKMFVYYVATAAKLVQILVSPDTSQV